MKQQCGFTRMGWDLADYPGSRKRIKRRHHKRERWYAKKMLAMEFEKEWK